jgi:hypothetical protein
VTRTAIRLVLGVGLTGLGAISVGEEWWPAAAGYAVLSVGLTLLVVALWRWLERDLGRRVRWSDEHRARVLSWAGQPVAPPKPGPAVDSPEPSAPRQDALPAPVAEVGTGRAAE